MTQQKSSDGDLELRAVKTRTNKDGMLTGASLATLGVILYNGLIVNENLSTSFSSLHLLGFSIYEDKANHSAAAQNFC
jgi:hypothetical protein